MSCWERRRCGEAGVYIFGIERIPLSGDREFWTVRDSVYPDVSAFADEYVRTRQLMIYSNCIQVPLCGTWRGARVAARQQLHCFDESMDFGENRLFNSVGESPASIGGGYKKQD